MFTEVDAFFIGVCLEGLFYGLYSGIFIIYLQCPSKTSRTAIIVFYALCLLYALSTIALLGNIVNFILELCLIELSPQLQIELIFRITIVILIATGICDFIAQCIIIYRCWIVWGQNIRIVIIPSFLAFTYIATWLVSAGTRMSVKGQSLVTSWGNTLTLTALSVSMAVNTLVTGLIVFRILKVFLQVKASSTSIERALGSTKGSKIRNIMFVIIESGMALFAIQLVRMVLGNLTLSTPNTVDIVIGLNQMFNGIAPTIILVRVSMGLSFDDRESFEEATASLCFNNNPQSDPNALQRVGSSTSSMPPQGKDHDEEDAVPFQLLPSP